MSITLGNIVSAGVAALALVVIIDMLRRGKLRERHALWWLGAGLLGLVVTLFPGLLEGAARALGVADPLNLAFFGAIIVLFLVSLQQATELTRAEEKARVLAEKAALLEGRLKNLEDRAREES